MLNRFALVLAIFCSVPLSAHEPAGGPFAEVIDESWPSIVKLTGTAVGKQEGYASGVIVSPDGRVVTAHSLMLDTPNLRAVTADGQAHRADVIFEDRNRQLALLQLKPADEFKYGQDHYSPEKRFPYLKPAGSEDLQSGSYVLALGNPFKVADGSEQASVALGVLSTRTALDARRRTRDFPYAGPVLVIDAITSNPGAAGGALIDIDGNWIGLIGRIVVSNTTHTRLNYAVPIEVVAEFLKDAETPAPDAEPTNADRPDKPGEVYHGIKVFELGYQKKLVYVDHVRAGSPADRAGLRKDDLILQANNEALTDTEEFKRIVRQLYPGDQLRLLIKRGEEIKTVELTLEEKP